MFRIERVVAVVFHMPEAIVLCLQPTVGDGPWCLHFRICFLKCIQLARKHLETVETASISFATFFKLEVIVIFTFTSAYLIFEFVSSYFEIHTQLTSNAKQPLAPALCSRVGNGKNIDLGQ